MTPFSCPVNTFSCALDSRRKRQSVVGILVAPDDRQLQLVQLGDQPPLGRLGAGELRQAVGVGVVGPLQRSARTTRTARRD